MANLIFAASLTKFNAVSTAVHSVVKHHNLRDFRMGSLDLSKASALIANITADQKYLVSTAVI